MFLGGCKLGAYIYIYIYTHTDSVLKYTNFEIENIEFELILPLSETLSLHFKFIP